MVRTLTDIDACNVVVITPEGVVTATGWPQPAADPLQRLRFNASSQQTADILAEVLGL